MTDFREEKTQMHNAVRQFRAVVAALSWQHWALALVVAVSVGYGAHREYGGLLAPVLFGAPVGLTWVALVAVWMTYADDDPTQQ